LDAEDVPMDQFTPKPKGWKVEPSGLQETESEDEDFETPKALKLVPMVTRIVFSDSDPDYMEVVETGVNSTDQEGSTTDKSGIQESEIDLDSDLRKLKSIDLTKIHNDSKTQALGKDRRAF
jgi:hypothetical protein